MADIKIATGLVEPHFMAGWSGGRKVIAPGVAHHSTIRTFHSARFMEDPAATSCNLVGNPLHEEQLEIVRMIGGDILALNTVIDEHRNLVFASFGEVIESHRSAVEFVQRATSVTVDRRFKTIVTSAAGYPLDATYYQTVKGMVTPIDILEPGGDLIIVSECSEGVGSPEFRAAQERLVSLGPDAFLETLTSKALADIDEWQTEMQLRPMRIGRIALYAPALSDADHAVTGVERIRDLSAEIAASIARQGDMKSRSYPRALTSFHFSMKQPSCALRSATQSRCKADQGRQHRLELDLRHPPRPGWRSCRRHVRGSDDRCTAGTLAGMREGHQDNRTSRRRDRLGYGIHRWCPERFPLQRRRHRVKRPIQAATTIITSTSPTPPPVMDTHDGMISGNGWSSRGWPMV